MPDLTPLEKARRREKTVYSCLECKKCVKVGGWWYCERSGKMLHPMMLERISPSTCKHAEKKEGSEDA